MKINRIMACVKPLLYESSDDAYRYTLVGTCFLVEQSNELYAITARHCLEKWGSNFAPEEIRIPSQSKSGTWLRFSELAITDPKLENDGLVDLAVLRIAQETLNPEEKKAIAPFPILGIASNCVLSPVRCRLVFAGHPLSNNTIDYDNHTFSYQCCWGKAKYLGPSEEHGCHKMRLTDTGFIHDVNGLSGSPVFQLIEGHNQKGFIYLAGMILRASMASGLAHFVDASHIYPMLDILRNPR